VPADVDRHPWQLAGAIAGAGVLSIVGQAGQLLSGDGGNDPDIVVMGAGGASRQASSIGGEIIQRELRRPNTLRYRVGAYIEIGVDKDFYLPARGQCQ
jgi:type IV secretory pathway VirB10-like protein